MLPLVSRNLFLLYSLLYFCTVYDNCVRAVGQLVVYIYSFNMQLGRTKVFLRAGQIGILDSCRAEVLDNSAKLIQRRLKTYIAFRDFISTKAAAFVLQAYCRGSLNLYWNLSFLVAFL